MISQEWKLANVVPVPKKYAKMDIANYRSISLTCLVMNIFEKIIRDEILIKCSGSHLLIESQHGFLPAKSCETQMLYFQECLTSSLNNDI